MLKVWGRNTSFNVQKVMWTVGELGLPHVRGRADGAMGHASEPDIASLNPNRLVPVIDDNGFVLWESNAIVRYLVAAYGKGTLLPASLHERARADQWMDWSTTTLLPDVIFPGLFRLFARVPAAERNADEVAAVAKRAADKLALVETQLQGRTFMLGNALSEADLTVGAMLYRYFTVPIQRPSLPNIEAYYKRLQERPAYREHVMIDWSSLKVPGA